LAGESTSGENGIRTLVVEDHAVVRAGLRLVLDAAEGIECVGEAGNADEAVRQAAELQPDVIVLDVAMPGRSGLEALPDLLEASPWASVLILSMQDDPAYVREAFGQGARGYVLKEAGGEELVTAVREVAAGGQYLNAAMGARLAAADRNRPDDDGLTEREREVLRLLALGYTNQEIAKQLYVSVRTAEAHRAHIMQKLRVTSRAELVRHALDTGLIGKEDA
jgi:two-component system response regulator NreC